MRRLCALVGAFSVAPGLALAQGATPPGNWQASVDQYFAQTLKDPYSAVKRQTSPVFRGAIKTPSSWGKAVDTWAVCFSVNAKNSYGAYTGEQTYLFLLSDFGSVREVLPSGNTLSRYAGAVEAETARKECSYQPAAATPLSPADLPPGVTLGHDAGLPQLPKQKY
jgi:hypothetical protein